LFCSPLCHRGLGSICCDIIAASHCSLRFSAGSFFLFRLSTNTNIN
jgi:hypothetical protein